MPIFEFECQDCRTEFDELVRSAEAVRDVTCPNCGRPRVRKKLSSFATRTGASRPALQSAAACAPGGT